MGARAAIKSIETDDYSKFKFIYFKVGKELTGRSEMVLGFRIYNYLKRHQEILQNINAIFGTYFAAISISLQVDPSIDFLADYESVSGCISLFFLKAFGHKRCLFRSVSDHQAVLAHEYIFLNHIYSGFKAMYLDQEVTIGTPVKDGDFKLYADYTEGKNPLESSKADGASLLYLDTTAPNFERLSGAILSDLESAHVSVSILYGDLHEDSVPSPTLAEYDEIFRSRGFSAVWIQDIEGNLDLGSETGRQERKRCSVYKRDPFQICHNQAEAIDNTLR
jgi:hypothetical protein